MVPLHSGVDDPDHHRGIPLADTPGAVCPDPGQRPLEGIERVVRSKRLDIVRPVNKPGLRVLDFRESRELFCRRERVNGGRVLEDIEFRQIDISLTQSGCVRENPGDALHRVFLRKSVELRDSKGARTFRRTCRGTKLYDNTAGKVGAVFRRLHRDRREMVEREMFLARGVFCRAARFEWEEQADG